MCSSVVCSTFTASLQPFATILFQIIFIIPEGNPTPAKQSLSFCLSPKSLATTHGFSDFYVYPVLDISHKWNHTTHGLLCLASFT